MTNKKKILFIQHASGFGGSAMSLLYTLQGIKKYSGNQYQIIVALAKWTKPLSEFYKQAGFDVVQPDWVDTYEHTQGVHFNLLNPINILKEFFQLIKIRKAKKNTKSLLEKIKPDIVHLNSIVLLGSALAAKEEKVPIVWHVREPAVRGLLGMRRSMLRNSLKKIPNKVIFICKADMESWGNPSNGVVVYNFVDFLKFNFKLPRPEKIQSKLIPKSDLIILFLGGVGRIKGGIYLIRAINKLMIKYPHKRIYMLFPGGLYDEPNYLIYMIAKKMLPLFNSGTYSQRIEKEINFSIYPENFIKFRFTKEVPQLLAASDVLVFPSIRPHFARPVIEAGAMAKPVIGSRLGGVEELIIHGVNGFLVTPKNVNDLTEKLERFLINPEIRMSMGVNGYSAAKEKFNAEKNIKLIVDIYDSIL